MLSAGYAVLRLLGRDSTAPRWMAGLAFVLTLLLACGSLWGAYRVFDLFDDREAVANAANEANAGFQKDKDEATGKADRASQAREGEHRTRIKRTEELIDEALEKGCVVADYLHSNGADCVRPPAGVSRSAP